MSTRATLFTLALLCLSTTAGGIAAAEASSAPAEGPGNAEAAVQETCSFPVSKTDTTGTEVTLDSEPQRIVALQPSDSQVLWEIGAQDRVVGMAKTQYTSYLSGRSGKTNIKNTDGSVSIEQVVGLQPDIVFAANATNPETVRELRRDGLTVYHFGTVQSLDEIARNVETVGSLVGSCQAARERANEFRLTVERAERAAEQADQRPSVLYYFFGFTTGSNTHIHDVIETAGGDNVAAEAGIEGYAELSTEIVVQQNPDWLVYPDDASVPTTNPYNQTTALRENQTVALDYHYISQPGPRVAIPLTHLAKTWNPDELAAANESVTMANVSTPNRTATDQSSSSGPGFGVAVSLVALLTAGLLARRD